MCQLPRRRHIARVGVGRIDLRRLEAGPQHPFEELVFGCHARSGAQIRSDRIGHPLDTSKQRARKGWQRKRVEESLVLGVDDQQTVLASEHQLDLPIPPVRDSLYDATKLAPERVTDR